MRFIYICGIALMLSVTSLHAQQTALTTGNSGFALDLYKELAQEQDNLAFSPYSLSLSMAMLHAGARGETAEQLAHTLHWPNQRETIQSAFLELQQSLQDTGSSRLDIASSIWLHQDLNILPAYLNTITNQYDAQLGKVDFSNRPADAVQDINGWVARQTDGRIEDLLKPGAISPLTRLVLANAIYFKGSWATAFPLKNTKSAPFHLVSGETVQVPTMHQSAQLSYAADETMQALALPYKGNQLSMLIILPKTNLQKWERRLTPANLHRLAEAMREEAVAVSLPRFNLQTDLDLGPSLNKLGMSDAFSSKADFAGINGKHQDLYVDKVYHSATLAVAEEGTEATAATGVSVATRGLPMQTTFRADKPFIYLIRHNETGALLFMGRVMDPR